MVSCWLSCGFVVVFVVRYCWSLLVLAGVWYCKLMVVSLLVVLSLALSC